MESTEKEWFVCAESGNKFQYPDGAKCFICKRMVSTPHYLYVDMDPVCLPCRKVEMQKILDALKDA
jgi:hypothetical protein